MSDDGMTLDEVRAIQALPEYANRVAILCYEDGDELVSSWDGREVRQGNVFGLDSRLNDAGAPQPHNLFLVSREDYEKGLPQ